MPRVRASNLPAMDVAAVTEDVAVMAAVRRADAAGAAAAADAEAAVTAAAAVGVDAAVAEAAAAVVCGSQASAFAKRGFALNAS
jgi:hypothetical protein